ncbi:hypothetical protein HMPREF1624_02083 [Sporothrix schenckii ATCC 58251]|uniref:Uncharacterized protein n=1 Tax=Sporothrix schenckii (strain ATCC 58251 / de Perez 2211183) TaxID=1391915 RepID=U7Q1G9_SPOS1|nr:hypothetical protein HMPREF1624_02083 [Sporothrix schenckii ATCC 58251]
MSFQKSHKRSHLPEQDINMSFVNSIGAGQSNGGNLVVTDGNGFNTNLIYGIGSQFMTLPLATARWSQTLPDVLDELQYLTMYDAHSPTWTVKYKELHFHQRRCVNHLS